MTSYQPIVTLAGRRADQASKLAGGAPVRFASIVLGDANGNTATPLETMTQLINPIATLPVTRVYANPADPTIVMVEAVWLPDSPRGFTVREMGVMLADGTLYAVGAFPETFMPLPSQGVTRGGPITVPIFETLASGAVVIFNNPGQFATEQWVMDNTSGIFAALLSGLSRLKDNVFRLIDFARNQQLRIEKLEAEVAWLRAQADRANTLAGLYPAAPTLPDLRPGFRQRPWTPHNPDPAPNDPGAV